MRWDIKTAVAASFRAAHPDFVPFGDFIEECAEAVRPSDYPDKSWPVYGVNNRGGVFFSHHQKGSEFNSPYKAIRSDWFFHNPTRANVGSLGRVPDVEADAITSPEYQVWRIKDSTWLPEYAEILIQMPFFNALVQLHRVGAVKQRLYVRNLMEIPVPRRTTDAQRAIVRKWHDARLSIADAEAEATRIEQRAGSDFLRELGLQSPDETKRRKALAVMWSSFDRWGVDWSRQRLSGIDLDSGRFEPVALGELVDLVQYGTSEKANIEGRGSLVLRMNNIVDGVFDFTSIKHVELPTVDVERLRLVEGDILFNRTNSKELVGKCAVFHGDCDCVFASYLIRIKTIAGIADPDFVAYVINGPIGRQQIDAMSRQIIGQANVNSTELRSLRIPLPPPNVQRDLINIVVSARKAAADARRNAESIRKTAIAEVEAAILGVA